MNNSILLIVGASGCGKTSVVNALEELCGLSSVASYTTRPPRYKGEHGHIFVTEERMDEIMGGGYDVVAFTEFNGYRYCATADQVEENDIYVIDPSGVEFFVNAYKGSKKIKLVYLYCSNSTRFNRMLDRGDSVMDAAKRLENDSVEFSRDRVDEICSLVDKHDVRRIFTNDKLRTAQKIFEFVKE